jgi:hypothetical protein
MYIERSMQGAKDPYGSFACHYAALVQHRVTGLTTGCSFSTSCRAIGSMSSLSLDRIRLHRKFKRSPSQCPTDWMQKTLPNRRRRKSSRPSSIYISTYSKVGPQAARYVLVEGSLQKCDITGHAADIITALISQYCVDCAKRSLWVGSGEGMMSRPQRRDTVLQWIIVHLER